MKNKFSPSYRAGLWKRAEATYDLADAAFFQIADGITSLNRDALRVVMAWRFDDVLVGKIMSHLYRTGDRLSEMSQA